MTIAAVADGFSSVEDAMVRIDRHLRRARRSGARLVVFPECALGGYLAAKAPGAAPEPGTPLSLDGPELEQVAELAGDTVVCVGITEDAPEGPYSSAVCLDGSGILGVQRKVHLPPGEKNVFLPGDGFAALDTPVGRIGMLVCYDKCFPEAALALALDGAEVVASLAAWPLERKGLGFGRRRDIQARHFDLLDEARAVENQIVWVSANYHGSYGGRTFGGRAKVVHPDGRVLACTGRSGGLATATIDPATAVAGVRAPYTHLVDRRPAAYAPPARAASTAGPAGATAQGSGPLGRVRDRAQRGRTAPAAHSVAATMAARRRFAAGTAR